jgi:hypothetical protein
MPRSDEAAQKASMAAQLEHVVQVSKAADKAEAAAASKEMRVRVESSAKRFTIVRPRSVGNFLTAPSLTRASSAAVSRIEIASDLLRSAIESKCFIT